MTNPPRPPSTSVGTRPCGGGPSARCPSLRGPRAGNGIRSARASIRSGREGRGCAINRQLAAVIRIPSPWRAGKGRARRRQPRAPPRAAPRRPAPPRQTAPPRAPPCQLGSSRTAQDALRKRVRITSPSGRRSRAASPLPRPGATWATAFWRARRRTRVSAPLLTVARSRPRSDRQRLLAPPRPFRPRAPVASAKRPLRRGPH